VVKQGVAYSAANVDHAWIGTDGRRLFEAATGCPVLLLNDADAAGLAEMRFGAGRDQSGVVILLTIGTGVGSGLFVDGILVPNSELGHLKIRGKDAEDRISDRARDQKGLSWKKWAKRFNEYLRELEVLISPDLIILGGGLSKEHERFLSLLEASARIV